jgi:hypothetical protein
MVFIWKEIQAASYSWRRLFPYSKTTLMFLQTLINRFFILGFMVLVGFSMAKSIQASSPLGFLLAIVSLGLGIYFTYLLQQLKGGR